MPTLLVVIATTRPGRAGPAVGRWFVDRAREHGGFELVVVDLAELDLPFLDEPKHPRFADYERDHTHAWSATVAAADAVVFVTAEYNYGYPAPLKNAIDYLAVEWRYKPLGFVSYGGVAAGTRAVQQLKQVVSAFPMFPIGPSVNVPFFQQFMTEGDFRPNGPTDEAATAVLDELVRVEAAVRPLR